MVGDSWTHGIARWMVRPLVGTRVTPNHLTTLRLLTGLAACACFAVGDRDYEIGGGVLWLLSALLDRADGELARLGGTTSEWGHRYDCLVDMAVTALFFVGAGVGMRDGWAGGWAVAAGLCAGAGVLAAEVLAEAIDRRGRATGEKAYAGFAGFDFDDVLYLFAPLVWLGWHPPFVLPASIGAPAFALLTFWKLERIRRRERGRESGT